MTTKPKARKFRVKRSTPDTPAAADAAAPRAQTAAAAWPEPAPDALRPPVAQAATNPAPRAVPEHPPVRLERPAPVQQAARAGEVASAKEVSGELDIDAIRREGLTGRQLRMARRVAQKHALAPTSDFDAVRLLREKGIDPFQRSNMLELVVPQDGNQNVPAQQGNRQPIGQVQLPQTVPAGGAGVPSTEVNPAERRQREISQIQRDITRRRRRKLGLLLVRLAFFVLLPSFAAGYYFYKLATPMYATDSQFLIIQSEGGGGASPFGGILPTQFANSADSIATQAYLQSKDAMLRLDSDVGFKSHFSQPNVDPIQRLDVDATNEEAYKVYKKNVKIGYDPTEGVIRMEVIAADPQVSASFSENLIKYAEERVNDLSKQKREDGMRDALEGFEQAQQNRRNAQEALIKMQVENGVDPEAEIAAIRGQITTYEGLLIDQARTEANRQVRYLTVAVQPVAPQEATYPRKFENTILAFLIFAGIYLMLSLTAAILREQVTS